VTIKEAVIAWSKRQADSEGLGPRVDRFIIQSDGFVYAMPAPPKVDALSWWLLPYLGPEGEEAFARGDLTD
jgi:hypothetical protein